MSNQSAISVLLSRKLDKAITIFMVPFYYESGKWQEIQAKLKRWQPASEEVYNEDGVLYPYIIDLFKQKGESQNPRLKILEFNSIDQGINSNLFIDRILGKVNYIVLGKNTIGKQNPDIISFKLCNKKNNAPHLFISPIANIGILTFSVELIGNNITMLDLTKFNYYCNKRNFFNSYQCVCFRPDKPKDNQMVIDMQVINSQIPDFWKQSQHSTRKNVEYLCWNFDDFVNFLLGTIGKTQEGQNHIKYFSRNNMHLFTFLSIPDEKDEVKKEDLYKDLLTLSRCEITNHMLPYNQLIQDGAVMRTFENILFASSFEGTAMACIGKEYNAASIKNLHNNFSHQYLLIYLLALIQRYTLLSIELKIKNIKSQKKPNDKSLWEHIDIISRIKMDCYYTDVSIHTQHSQFYQHCCRNLAIPETFREVGEKIELLRLMTARNVEHRQRILSFIVAVLTIAQVMQAAYELIKPRPYYDDPALKWSLIIGVVCAIILVVLMRKDVFKSKR